MSAAAVEGSTIDGDGDGDVSTGIDVAVPRPGLPTALALGLPGASQLIKLAQQIATSKSVT